MVDRLPRRGPSCASPRRRHGGRPPVRTWVSLALSPLLLGGVRHQLRRRNSLRAPLVDLQLFRNRTFGVGCLASLTFSVVPPSFFFVLAVYLQQGRGFTPLFSGVIFVAVGAGFFAAMLTAERMAVHLKHQTLAAGALVTALGCVGLAVVAGTSSSLELAPGLAVIGFGMGTALVPLAATVLRDVAAQHAGAASGVLSTAQQLGGALGVPATGVVFYRVLRGIDFVHALTVSLWFLAALTLMTAGLLQFLPRSPA